MSDKKNGGREMRNIKLSAIIVIIFSIVFYLISIHVEPKSKLFSDVLKVIAGASLTAGIFSIFLGFSDFVNYVAKRLRDIVIEPTYLRELSMDKKEELKRTIDSEIFGRDAIRTPDSLYTFADQQMANLYKAQYRKEFHDMYYFYESEDPNYWKVQNHATYTLFKSHTGIGSISVPMGGVFDVHINKEKKETDDEIVFEDLKIEETVKIDSETFFLRRIDRNGDSKYVIKHDENNKYIKTDFDVNIELHPDGKNKVKYGYSIVLNDELFKEKQYVFVEIVRNQLVSKKENSLFLGVNYPTKDVLFTCQFDKGRYRMYAAAFAFNQSACSYRTENNSAFVDVKEWLLPGHGAVITWRPATQP